jgi:electron-transferring-flavoprotein dehydrogenase
MELEREILEVDVLFIGAGPASLSGALHLQNLIDAHNQNLPSGQDRLRPSIAVIEKGREIGAHCLSGAILDPRALEELFPNYRDLEIPLAAPVTQDDIYYLTPTRKIRFPVIPPPLNNHGNYIISLNRFVQWLGEKVAAKGIDLFPGFAGTDLIFDGDQLVGIGTGNKGVDQLGQPKTSFEPGVDIMAKVVVFGEGARGSLTKQLVKRLNLDQGKNPQVYAIGIKEVWELPEESSLKGQVIHTLGYPLKHENYGGGFVYNMGSLLSLGLVIGLDYEDPSLDPHQCFQQFKTHPLITGMLKGAKLAHYGAKAIPEGGYYSIPKSALNGGLIIGDSAGLLNSQRLKGIHLAMKSGLLAAETLMEGLLKKDFSEATLAGYETRLKTSWVGKELFRVRNFRQGFEHGLLSGMFNAGLQTLTAGRGWKDPLKLRAGHERMRQMMRHDEAADAKDTQTPEFDGELIVSKATDIYFSSVKHEEDQPAHLVIADYDICNQRCVREYGNPCIRFCPATVYEMVDREDGKGRQLQLNPSNCVHCKTCDIMDPYQIITWVPPEGGSGPNYLNL